MITRFIFRGRGRIFTFVYIGQKWAFIVFAFVLAFVPSGCCREAFCCARPALPSIVHCSNGLETRVSNRTIEQ